jgi:hypothetical protein
MATSANQGRGELARRQLMVGGNDDIVGNARPSTQAGCNESHKINGKACDLRAGGTPVGHDLPSAVGELVEIFHRLSPADRSAVLELMRDRLRQRGPQ